MNFGRNATFGRVSREHLTYQSLTKTFGLQIYYLHTIFHFASSHPLPASIPTKKNTPPSCPFSHLVQARQALRLEYSRKRGDHPRPFQEAFLCLHLGLDGVKGVAHRDGLDR